MSPLGFGSSSSSSSSKPNRGGPEAVVSVASSVLRHVTVKQWRRNQIRKFTDNVFDLAKNDTERANLKFEDVYIGVLLVYNDIIKRLPGRHIDPPSRGSVRDMIRANDINRDKEIDREEFVNLMKQITANTFVAVCRGLMLTLVTAPTMAMATKQATEHIPLIGKFVKKIPNSVYASVLTLSAVLIQQVWQES